MQFQVCVRVPTICLKGLHALSGNDGLYVEPRGDDGRSSDSTFAVIWITDHPKGEVLHLLKTTEKAIALARFGQKWGLRVFARDASAVQTKVKPEDDTPHITVQHIYELRPLPHGTQKKSIQALLTSIGWQAKPLQPGKADISGMSWKVGASEAPPSVVLQTQQGDVTVTLQKQLVHDSPIGRILSSQRTQAHVRQQHRSRAENKENKAPTGQPPASQGSTDPWHQGSGKDPWAHWKQPLQDQDHPMQVVPKIQSLETQIRDDVTRAVEDTQKQHKDHTSQRLNKLEVDINEMKQQHVKYEGWFREAGFNNKLVLSASRSQGMNPTSGT